MTIGTCDFCGSEGVEVKGYEHPSFLRDGRPQGEMDTFCLLCASTPAGNAFVYPEQYRGSSEVLKTLSFIGNEILKELRKA